MEVSAKGTEYRREEEITAGCRRIVKGNEADRF